METYPEFSDPDFNLKISNKREFADTTYDGNIYGAEEQAERMSTSEFELAPHQVFVRNFLSSQTPYNGLLLYHGVGTGKTCSAITLSEEYREYMKQMGIAKKILIIASENVRNNYKDQLFDERKLKERDGRWTMDGCTGDKFLREINPLELPGLNRRDILQQIDKIISKYYKFVGYEQFANTIQRLMVKTDNKKSLTLLLQNEYEQRMIIIDEVQNIKFVGKSTEEMSSDTKNPIAAQILEMISHVSTKLLLLSATPMFHSPTEIVWLLNLLNTNDKRTHRKKFLEENDVFDKNGSFKPNGKEELIEWARGYVSFVRGENPYTFPYRIYPSMIKKPAVYEIKMDVTNRKPYTPLKHIDAFVVPITGLQKQIYDEEAVKLFGKSLKLNDFNVPLQILDMVYPVKEGIPPYGKVGLFECILKNERDNTYSYKDGVDRIFEPDKLNQYSSKLKTLCDHILNSTGIVLVYSQYIWGGCLSVALALESIGITRYGDQGNLLNDKKYAQRDALTMNEDAATSTPARYTMITGNAELSPNPQKFIKISSGPDNMNGEQIKVIIISKTGSEGIDLKNIRQIHIIDPWYNMSKMEQIIGRGIRHRSHTDLPFKQRNAEIFMYASHSNTIETVDLHLYQRAETIAIQIGEVSRLLKENAVDCILNKDQQHFTQESMGQTVPQVLSRKVNGKNIEIDYEIGDKPFSNTCDYLETCQYTCNPADAGDAEKNQDTYSDTFLVLNNDYLIRKIKQLFKRRYAYSKSEILSELNLVRKYSDIQIFSALQRMVEDSSEVLYDQFNRAGILVNINQDYYFHPQELVNTHVSMSERRIPISKVKEKLKFFIPLTSHATTEQASDILKSIKKTYASTFELAEKVLPLIELPNNEAILVASLLEKLPFEKTTAVLNHVMTHPNEFNSSVYAYFNQLMFAVDGSQYIRLVLDHKTYTTELLTYDDVQWKILDFDKKIAIKRTQAYIDMNAKQTKLGPLNHLIGFVGGIGDKLVFKTIDKENYRTTGETCLIISKQKTSAKAKLHDILHIEDLDERLKNPTLNVRNLKKLAATDICFLLEFVLRHLDATDKRCFLNPIEYVLWMKQRIEKK